MPRRARRRERARGAVRAVSCAASPGAAPEARLRSLRASRPARRAASSRAAPAPEARRRGLQRPCPVAGRSRAPARGRSGRRPAQRSGIRGRPRRRGASVAPTLLDALEHRAHERPNRVEHVSTLLHEDGRDAERAEPAAGLAEAVLGHVERRVRIAAGCVHPERDDERLAPVRAGGSHEPVDAREPRLVARARRERHVQVGVVAVARPALFLEAEEVREPALAGIDVHRRREHVAPVPEDRLRPVPVVRVDVEHGDPRDAAVAQVLRGDGRGVEIAGASVGRARDVMPRRAAARVGGRRPAEDELDRGQRGVDRRPRRDPGSRADRRHRVEGPRAGAGGKRGGDVRLDLCEKARRGEEVAGHAVLAGILVQARGRPRVPGSFEERDELGVVDRVQRLVAVRLGRDERGTRLLESDPDPLGALRHLVRGDGYPDPDPDARVVEPVRVGPHDWRREGHQGAGAR